MRVFHHDTRGRRRSARCGYATAGYRTSCFHSEHDFQHAFAQVVHDLDQSLELRLEVPQGDREHLDLRCFGPKGRTAIEFKYFTSPWLGIDPNTGEEFRLSPMLRSIWLACTS